jgi:hypothetical protein
MAFRNPELGFAYTFFKYIESTYKQIKEEDDRRKRDTCISKHKNLRWMSSVIGKSTIDYTELAKQYCENTVDGATQLLANTLGVVEASCYVENFRRELDHFREAVMSQENHGCEDYQSRIAICNFLLGNDSISQKHLLPDYILMEIVHNNNYVFESKWHEIIQLKFNTRRDASSYGSSHSQLLDGIISHPLEYKVNTKELLRITKAEHVSCCNDHCSKSVHFKLNCEKCAEEMYKKRMETLRVTVSMYLIPMLCQSNVILCETLKSKNVKYGLTPNTLLLLGGYGHVTPNRNYIGLSPKDNVKNILNVYQRPPSADVLLKRIHAAVEKRQADIAKIAEDMDLVDTWTVEKKNKSKKLKLRKNSAISHSEWTTWISQEIKQEISNNQGPHSENTSIPTVQQDEDISPPAPGPLCKDTRPQSDSSSNDTSSTCPKSNSSSNNTCAGKDLSVQGNCNPKITTKGNSSNRTGKVGVVKNKNKPVTPHTKINRVHKKKRIHVNSLGSKLTVHLPTDSHSSDDDTYFNDLEEENNVAEEEESCNGDPIGVNDMENDGHSTRHPENKDISITYDDLQEHHYQYDPNHYHDNDHCYYKGFQHLCCLRKHIPLSNVPYDPVSSQKRFTDQAFHQVFGAKIDHSSTSNVNTATTHVLNRFDDDTSGENPIVGIKYDALSQSIVDTIIGIANTREFLKDQAGKYIRAATTEPCQGYRVPCFPDSEEYSQCDRMYPLFRIGQKEDSNARLFMGIAATPEETHLLDLVNKFSEHVLGGSVSYDHNFMMMSVSNIEKSFGAHSDHSLWHGKVDVNCPYISKNGLPLRSESEAYTLTMCINKSQTTKKLVEISWYDKTKADADNPHGKLLHQCVTRANTIHFQFPGSQANGVVHAGDWVENSEWDEPTDFEEHAEQCDQDDEDWRIVVSFRQNVSSSSCPACYLKRFDLLKMHGCELIGRKPDDWWTSILDSIEQGVEPEKCHMDSINNGPINQIHQAHAQEKPESEPDMNNKKKYFLNHFKNRDQYKNCSQEEVKKYDIPIQDTYICEEACLSDTYNTYDYIRAMLKNCIVPNISYQMEEASSARKKKNKVGGAVDITNTGEENADMSYKPVTGKASKRERKTTIEEFPPLLYHSRGKTKGREYFKRDRVYPLDTVLNCAKINWSKKMDKQQELKPPMRTEDWRIFNTFICHQKYKNSKSSLIEFFTNPTCRWVDVIGSGGSPSKMDKNGADWDSVLKDKQDVAHLPHSQPMNDMNSTIVQAAQNNRTVAVFIGKEVYDYVWDDKRMKSLLNSGMKKVPLSKDNLYFLGYFHCIKQHSKKGMEHSELAEEAEGETSIDTQRLMRFREMPYFRLTLELIPDKLLDILPV